MKSHYWLLTITGDSSLANTRHVQQIHRLPIVNRRHQWQKELLVAAPWWLLNPKDSQASGHKLNETLKCILSQHWFPESLYEQNSMAVPLIKHPQHVQQSSGGFLLITTGTAGNSELIVLSASPTELLWIHPMAALGEAITQSHIYFMLIVHFQEDEDWKSLDSWRMLHVCLIFSWRLWRFR